MKVLRFIARVFIKVTGFIPYLIVLKPRVKFASSQAKIDFKKNKRNCIFVSNHTSIFDFFFFIYFLFFQTFYTLVAEFLFHNVFMRGLNNIFNNICVERNRNDNINPISSLLKVLKNKSVLIFPEGKLEKEKGTLEHFSDSASLLSILSGKCIIPIYIDGKYGFFHRCTVFVGEKITYENSSNNEHIEKDVPILENKIESSINNLREKYRYHKKYKTSTPFTFKYWLLDFMKITSIPFFYLVFLTKKTYLCKRKEIHKALKYNALLCSNHVGPCDPFFYYLHFFSRRSKIIATEEAFTGKFMNFCLTHCGVIKYHKTSMNQIDLFAFKESLETLIGNGVVGIFPEGHINFHCELDNTFKEGAATLSLLTHSPIIPFFFENNFRYFHFNKVILGEPIYPEKIFGKEYETNSETISKYNQIIYNSMKRIYNLSVSKKEVNYGKTRNIK